MMFFRRKILLALGFFLAGAASYYFYVETKINMQSGLKLATKWEGAVIDHNFRDVGKSLNSCYGKNVFKEGVMFRANVWFSGWNCANVGEPEVIYSLNFSPEREEEYFCKKRDDATYVVGRHFNKDVVFHNLEFLETWNHPQMREGTCETLKDAFREIRANKRVLFHCDGGRDRTGVYAALLAALVGETLGLLEDPQYIAAIECDYRRTKSLEADKFGRMASFIDEAKKFGSLGDFLQKQCPDLGKEEIAAVATKLLYFSPVDK